MMITAQSARETATRILNAITEKQKELFDEAVSEAALQGKFETDICFSETLSKDLLALINDLGYAIAECKDPRDGTVSYLITW